MKYIVLDRDGVINHDSEFYIKSPDEWLPIPGSLEAIATLNRNGYHVLIATNQSGVARGFYDLEMLDAIHEKLMRELAAVGGHVDEIFFCPHHPDEGCECRKPRPGLFYKMKEKYPLTFSKIFFVGDSFSDIQVAEEIGCAPLLVLTGKGELTLKQHPEAKKIPTFPNLASAVDYVISR